MRIALVVYSWLMAMLLPVVILYIYRRARKDKRYSDHLGERFGNYPASAKNAVWIHAVSLGEMRAAAPLIRALIDKGEIIVTTHFTPAGRAAAQTMFADEYKSGKLFPVYVPLEFNWAYKRFFKAFSPKYGLVMEVEIWPRMIASARRYKIPLFLCNGHYTQRSFERDQRWFQLRRHLATGFTGLLIKSAPDAERFKALGAPNVIVTGELRFDQNIPEHLTTTAANLLLSQQQALHGRTIITIASAVEGEDAKYIEAIHRIRKVFADRQDAPPLFVYVPRAPERFDRVATLIQQENLVVQKRSMILDNNLADHPDADLSGVDVLLGDSLGEMYFYLALANLVIVGGSFIPSGAHNVIEPLALKKTVLVGPFIWTIAHTAETAIEAKALIKVETIAELSKMVAAITAQGEQANQHAEAFYNDHKGAVARTLVAIDEIIR